MKILVSKMFYVLFLIVSFFVFAACSLEQSAADNQKSADDNTFKAAASGPVKIQTFQSGAAVQKQISERIKIVNTGTSAIALSNVKIRYYIAYQGSTSYNFACDYSPIGSGNVKSAFTAMSPAYTGAEAYQEISFAGGAGNLAAGASVELQCRIWKSDWSGIDNSLNYSYNPVTAYVEWNKVTLYQSGSLSFGVEPGTVVSSSAISSISSVPVSSSISSSSRSSVSSAPVSSAISSVPVSSSIPSSSRSSVSSIPVSSAASSIISSASVSSSSASQGPAGIKIQTYQNGAVIQGTLAERITIVNTGTSAIALSTIKIRYYFTFQGYSAYGFSCDYTPIGNGNVQNAFASMNPAVTGADAYQEISFTAGAGSLNPGASVELQCRLWKLNWTTIDASLNYSYNPSTSYSDCSKVTGYINSSLVWGNPPSGTASSSSQSSSAVSGLKVLANNKSIILGTALVANNLNDIACVAVATNEFNGLAAGNEMKFSYLEPDQNTFTYTTADNMVNFAAANGMKMRGHTLLWHSDYQVPQWIKNLDYSLLAAAERNHVSNIIAHFGNKIYCWDVANEIVLDSGAGLRNRTASGGDYSVWASSPTDDSVIRAAFIQARATANALGISPKLILNDYNIEEMGNAKTEKFYQIVTNWLASGVPIDGVGFQCHFMEKYTPNYTAIRANIDRFQALGLEVQFTEMDVRIQLPAAQTNLDNQAGIYGNMMQIALDKKLKTFVIWGISDKDSWVITTFPGYGAPLIFDDNYNKKPAYTAIQQKLSQ